MRLDRRSSPLLSYSDSRPFTLYKFLYGWYKCLKKLGFSVKNPLETPWGGNSNSLGEAGGCVFVCRGEPADVGQQQRAGRHSCGHRRGCRCVRPPRGARARLTKFLRMSIDTERAVHLPHAQDAQKLVPGACVPALSRGPGRVCAPWEWYACGASRPPPLGGGQLQRRAGRLQEVGVFTPNSSEFG